MSDFSQYYDVQRYELHKSQISDDFVYWFRNGENIFQAVFRKKSLKTSGLYWRVPYIYYTIISTSGKGGQTFLHQGWDKHFTLKAVVAMMMLINRWM